jgi:hypothetical protein
MAAPPLTVARARYAALTRDRGPDDPVRAQAYRELQEAQTEYAYDQFEKDVAEFVASFPPLSEQRLQRIGAMLRAGSDLESTP